LAAPRMLSTLVAPEFRNSRFPISGKGVDLVQAENSLVGDRRVHFPRGAGRC
jgi:hypothetical protein